MDTEPVWVLSHALTWTVMVMGALWALAVEVMTGSQSSVGADSAALSSGPGAHERWWCPENRGA